MAYFKLSVAFFSLLLSFTNQAKAQITEAHPLPEIERSVPGPKLYIKNTDTNELRIHFAGTNWTVKGKQMSKMKEVGAIPAVGGYTISIRLRGRKRKDSIIVSMPENPVKYYTSPISWVAVVLPGHDTIKWKLLVRRWLVDEDGPLKEKKPGYFQRKQMLKAQPDAEMVDPHVTFYDSLKKKQCDEAIIVMRDKSVVFPGDTLWFTACLLGPPGAISSTLSVEIYERASGALIDSSKWFVDSGISVGQIKCPAQGDYLVRMYTANSVSERFSLTVRGKKAEYLIYHLPEDTTLPILPGGLVGLGVDSGGYYIQKQYPTLQYYCAVVSDTTQPLFLKQSEWLPYDNCRIDTNYLSYDFHVKTNFRYEKQVLNLVYTQNGKSRKDIYPTLDSSNAMRLDHVAFYGDKSSLHYELNRGRPGDIVLDAINNRRPLGPFPSFIVDTVKQPWINLPGFAGVKAMDTAYVAPDWRTNKLAKLEGMYINDSLKFGSDARFRFSPMRDFRDTSEGILEYLGWKNSGIFSLDLVTGQMVYKNHTPYKWYVDERESDWYEVNHIPAYQIALFRAIDDQPEGMGDISRLCIYLRKGDDAKGIWPTNLKELPLEGYQIPVKWSAPDRSTLKWIPFATNEKIYLGTTPPFRVQIIAFWQNIPWFMGWEVHK